MKAFGKLAWTGFKLFLREPAAFFFTLVFPALLLVLFGAIFGTSGGEGRGPGTGGGGGASASTSRCTRCAISRASRSVG